MNLHVRRTKRLKPNSQPKNITTPIKAAEEGEGYIQRAMANTNQVTSAKSDLLLAAKQIPNAAASERKDSVLIRISGNAFAYGSTQIQQEFINTFMQLADVLRRDEFSQYPIRIEAHTSSLGSANANKNISMGARRLS